MKDEAQQRLTLLRSDYELGQAKLRDVEQEAVGLRDTLLRISGAIQVLEELLAERADNVDPAVIKVP